MTKKITITISIAFIIGIALSFLDWQDKGAVEENRSLGSGMRASSRMERPDPRGMTSRESDVVRTPLVRLLYDLQRNDVRRRMEAQREIRGMGRDAVPELVGLLGSEDPVERRQSAWALAFLATQGITSPGVGPALTTLLSDEHADTRLQAVKAIGAVRDPGTTGRLHDVLYDQDPRVRVYAAHYLVTTGHRDRIGDLVRITGDPQVGATAMSFLQLATKRNFTTPQEWRSWWDETTKESTGE